MKNTEREKLICSCDNLIHALNKSNKGFSKVSAKSRWETRKDDNPYFSHEKQAKRAKKYHKKLKKFWSSVEIEILKRYKKEKKHSIFSFLLSKRTERTDQDLEEDTWNDIIEDSVSAALLFSIFNDTIINELSISYTEAINNTVKLHDLSPTFIDLTPKDNVISEFTEYQRKFVDAIIKKRIDSLKDVTKYGIENGLNDKEIITGLKKRIKRIKDFNSARVVRSESVRASSRGLINAYKDVGIKKYMVLTALTACTICVDIAAGNPYNINDTYGRPIFHPNCRCTTIPFISY